MAHNLNLNEKTNEFSFFSTKEKAWHKLGQIVQDYPTSAEAIKFAHLDFPIEKRKMFTFDNLGKLILEVPNHFSTLRTDTEQVLGVVGNDYEIVQNIDAFAFFDSIVGGSGIKYETAGAFGKGERIFITAKLPNYIKVAVKDLIEQYLFFTTSHDGKGSIIAAFTPIRVVCNNTYNVALRNLSNVIKIRHTANAKERLEEAHKLMGIVNILSEQMEQVLNAFTKVKITDPQLMNLIQLAMAPNKETLDHIEKETLDKLSTRFVHTCDSVYEYAMSSPTQQTEATKGTAYGFYNAVTGYFQNVRKYKNDEVKMNSLLYGGLDQKKTQKAFDLCMNFMN